MPRIKYFTLLLAILLSAALHAQHCPFDGANLVAVKLVNAKGKTVTTSKYTVYLQEVDNPLADSCTYAPGLLNLKLRNRHDFFAECDGRYRLAYSKALQQRLQQKGVLAAASLFININQPERSCMLNDSKGNFDYRTRKFAVLVTDGKKKITVAVPEKAVQSLCTNNSLDDFEAVVIKIP